MKTLHSLLGFALLVLSLGMAQAQTSELIPVGAVGPRSQRLNLVFLSEGFTRAELDAGKFSTHVDGVLTYLFAQEPWSRYRSYFNVYLIEIASNESGTDNPYADPPYARDTYFGTGFHPQIDRLLVLSGTGSTRAYALLNKHVPEYDIPVVIVNDETYGGSGGPIAVASLDSFGAQLVEHEVGHSFAKLADEYDFDTPGYPDGEFPNATRKTVLSQIRWNMWIEPGTPLFTPEYDPLYTDKVGHFEGAHYRASGYFRPHDAALMRFLGRPPGAVTREAFVLNYYSRVSPVDAHSPVALKQTVTQRTPLTFSITPKVPSSGPPISVTWKVDNVAQPGTSPVFNIPSQDIGEGTHTVTALIKDPTDWVRRDPTGLVEETRTWTLTLSNQSEPPTINQGPQPRLVEVGSAASFSVDATAAGPGALSYQWYKNGKAIANARATTYSLNNVQLADGATYSVRVTGGSAFVESFAHLTVVELRVQSLVLAEGKAAVLSPLVGGPVLGYEWLRENNVITEGMAGFSGLGTAKLSISPLSVSDHSGYYSLKITTAAGSETFSTHHLQIFNNPPQHALAAGASLPDGHVAASYGGEGPYYIQVADIAGRPASTFGAAGLPPGLKVDTKTGAISGRPTAAKRDKAGNVVPYAVTLSAGNGKGTSKVTVNLLVHPLPAGMVGTFVAPIPRDTLNGDLGGRFDLVVSANGSYTGKVVLGTFSQALKGTLTTSGSNTASGTASIQRPGKPAPPPLPLYFTLSANDREVEGSITESEHVLAFDGWLNVWSKTVPAEAYDGYHTFVLGIEEPAGGQPTGYGGGSFTIARDGKTTVAGKTPDGETFTCASHASEFGRLVLFSLQKGKPQGSLAGRFELSDPEAQDGPDDADDANNIIHYTAQSVTWWKPASDNGKARVYKAGVGPVAVRLSGGRYTPPASVFAPSAEVELRFTGASLAEALEAGVSVPANNKFVVDAADEKVTLSVNPKLGTFTGKFSLLDDNPREIAPLKVPRAVTYSGYLIRSGTLFNGRGFFLLPDLPSTLLSDTPTTSPIQSGHVNLGELR